MIPIVARTFFRIQERLLGRNSFELLSELRRTERASRQEIEAIQLRRLRQLVRDAWEHTPYWRSVMEDEGITPESIQALSDVQRFPLLVKRTISTRREEMVYRDEGRRLHLVRTSGSTNEALQFYTNSHREAHINAARMRGHEWIGVRRGEREMYFWGSPIELSKQDRIKRLRDWLINDGLTNGFEIRAESVAEYFEYWMRWRPRLLFGYPSSFVLMVTLAEAQGIDLTRLTERGLKAICTTSEMLTEPDRERIAEGFGVAVYDSYGLREAGLVGHECAEGTMHTMDEQVLLETIDPATGEPTDAEGELVITSLISNPMPVIRYRTGDVVRLGRELCPCGRTLGTIAISGGRVADFVVTSEGKWVAGYFIIYICRSVKGIVKFQAIQEETGEIRVLLVTDESFPTDGVEQVRRKVRARLGGEDPIEVHTVDDIEPARSGKYRPVIGKKAMARQTIEADRVARAAGG
jgi:phenylacetate-CoA ligase